MPDSPSLADRSASFAQEIQQTLDGVLPGDRQIISVKMEGAERHIVQPEDRQISLFVGGEELAMLRISLYLSLDRTSSYLKTVRSDMAVLLTGHLSCGSSTEPTRRAG